MGQLELRARWVGIAQLVSLALLLPCAKAGEFAPSAGPATSSLLTTSTPILHQRDVGLEDAIAEPSAGPWLSTDDLQGPQFAKTSNKGDTLDPVPSAGPGAARAGRLVLLEGLSKLTAKSKLQHAIRRRRAAERLSVQSSLQQVAYHSYDAEQAREPYSHKHRLRRLQQHRNMEEVRMEFIAGSTEHAAIGDRDLIMLRTTSGEWILPKLAVTASLFVASFVVFCIGCCASGVYSAVLQGVGKRANAATNDGDVVTKKLLMAQESEGDAASLQRRQLLLLYASPLFIIDNKTDALQELPRIPFEREWDLLQRCLEAARTPGRHDASNQLAPAYLAAELLTASSLQRALASCQQGRISTAVIHISAHSHRNELGHSLVAENGKGSAHLVDSAHLEHMLPMNAMDASEFVSGVELVVLHTCNSKALGERFASGGVPHVVCADGDVLDSVSSVFIQALYARLFAGMTVMAAFRFALVALQTSPEIQKKGAHDFCLLPEGASHNSVIFNSRVGMESWHPHAQSSLVLHSPLESTLPTMPEDYLGRAFDVWSILQHLAGSRRVVVVCGANGTSPGVGKSVVLDAVHRAYELQVGGIVLAVAVRAITDPAMIHSPTTTWLHRIRAAVQAAREATASGDNPCAACSHASSWQAIDTDPVKALQGVISDLTSLAAECRTRANRKWEAGASAATRLLLMLDECDHLAQQQHFQVALCAILRSCPECKVILSSHQRLVGATLSHFKVVHHELHGLDPIATARLFLRRAHRLVRMEEIAQTEEKDQMISVSNTKHLKLLARHPAIDRLAGNPRRIIAIASLVGPSLRSLSCLPMHT